MCLYVDVGVLIFPQFILDICYVLRFNRCLLRVIVYVYMYVGICFVEVFLSMYIV